MTSFSTSDIACFVSSASGRQSTRQLSLFAADAAAARRTEFYTVATSNTRSMGWRPTVRSLIAASSFLSTRSQGGRRSTFALAQLGTTRVSWSTGPTISRSSLYNWDVWGHSSAGRAPAWHAGGRRFEPAWLHQIVRTQTAGSLGASRFVCVLLRTVPLWSAVPLSCFTKVAGFRARIARGSGESG